MTDPNYTTFTTNSSDSVRDADMQSREESAAFATSSGLGETEQGLAREAGLRGAVRSDLESGREWARERAVSTRARIADRPVEATLYALGLGVVIGMLLRR